VTGEESPAGRGLDPRIGHQYENVERLSFITAFLVQPAGENCGRVQHPHFDVFCFVYCQLQIRRTDLGEQVTLDLLLAGRRRQDEVIGVERRCFGRFVLFDRCVQPRW